MIAIGTLDGHFDPWREEAVKAFAGGRRAPSVKVFFSKEVKSLLFLKKKKQKDFCSWRCFTRSACSPAKRSPPIYRHLTSGAAKKQKFFCFFFFKKRRLFSYASSDFNGVAASVKSATSGAAPASTSALPCT
jgi:hypothetical protein